MMAFESSGSVHMPPNQLYLQTLRLLKPANSHFCSNLFEGVPELQTLGLWLLSLIVLCHLEGLLEIEIPY